MNWDAPMSRIGMYGLSSAFRHPERLRDYAHDAFWPRVGNVERL
jgi:hypothetical protein